MKAQISGIQPEDVGYFWPMVMPLIERVLRKSNGEYLAVDIYERLLDGTMQLWLISEELDLLSVLVTEVLTYPRKRICVMVLAAGEDLEALTGQLEVLEEWALSIGVDELRIAGRKGWKRVLESEGFYEPHVVLSKYLHKPDEFIH
ncbi:MAG: hypothetical protein ACWGQW_21615 [bacterium]